MPKGTLQEGGSFPPYRAPTVPYIFIGREVRQRDYVSAWGRSEVGLRSNLVLWKDCSEWLFGNVS